MYRKILPSKDIHSDSVSEENINNNRNCDMTSNTEIEIPQWPRSKTLSTNKHTDCSSDHYNEARGE